MKRRPKPYEELTFADDFLLCKILENDLDICKSLLEMILQVKIKKITLSKKQTVLDILKQAKSIRLDVYVEDDKGSMYDIEMQTTEEKNLGKRTRYYQSVLDINALEKGNPYKNLPKSYIIFICLSDPFGKDLPIYTFEEICKECSEVSLQDEAYKVVVNAACTKEDIPEDLRAFFRYLKTGKAGSGLTRDINEYVERSRSQEEWRQDYMALNLRLQEYFMQGREEGLEEGREKGIIEGEARGEIKGHLNTLIDLTKRGLLSLQTAISESGLSEAEFTKLLNK